MLLGDFCSPIHRESICFKHSVNRSSLWFSWVWSQSVLSLWATLSVALQLRKQFCTRAVGMLVMISEPCSAVWSIWIVKKLVKPCNPSTEEWVQEGQCGLETNMVYIVSPRLTTATGQDTALKNPACQLECQSEWHGWCMAEAPWARLALVGKDQHQHRG